MKLICVAVICPVTEVCGGNRAIMFCVYWARSNDFSYVLIGVDREAFPSHAEADWLRRSGRGHNDSTAA